MPSGTPSSDPRVRRLARTVLLPGFRGTSVPDWLRREVEAGLGGVCLFAPNVHDEDGRGDVAALTWDLHGLRDDVVVASDEEGGEVTRLQASSGSPYPTAAALGAVDDVAATAAVNAAIGRLCRDHGVDLALAPDVDVNADPDNPVIGLRSFGADPQLVARHAAAAVEGIQSAGVAACAKHFPGHGDTTTDSHLALPVVDVDRETLTRRDLVPFEAVVHAGVRAVMTAHLVVPALDERPATLSPAVLEVLRGDLGFSGLVVSDAVDMRAISAGVGRGPGAALALAAGVDLVCIGNPSHPEPYDDAAAFHEVHRAVLAAVDAGDLRVDRLEEAARRVGELAWWVGETRAAALRAAPDDGVEERLREVVATVSARSLRTGGLGALPGPVHVLDLRGPVGMAAGERASGVVAALRGWRDDVVVTGDEDVPPDGSLVAVVAAPRRSPDVAARLAQVLAARPGTVVVATGVPDERDDLGAHWARTYGDTRAAGAALVTALEDAVRDAPA